jgi:UDP-glucose 4-epimerase
MFNIAARSPLMRDDLPALLRDARAVILRDFPDAERIFRQHGWQLPQYIDRVYVIERAERALGYQPQHNFAEHLRELHGDEW